MYGGAFTMDILLQIASAIIIAVVSSIITTHLALSRFRTEKLWEAKSAAYTAIISALYEQLDAVNTDISEIKSMNEKEQEEIIERMIMSRGSLDHLRRMNDVGSLYLSSSAMKTLDKYFNDIENINEKNISILYLSQRNKITKSYIDKFLAIAKKDLKLTGST